MKKTFEKDYMTFMILVIALLVLAVFICLMFQYYKSDGKSCTANPLVYGVKNLEKINNNNVQCICSLGEGNSNQIIVTDKNISVFQYKILN